jgi:hypothetical protein
VNPIGYYFWLGGQAFEVLLIFPPAGLLMAVGLIGAVCSLPRVSPARWRQALAAVLLPLAVPAAILLCGVLLVHDTALDTEAPRWPEWLVGGLLVAHLPLAAALVCWLRGARWFALSVSAAVAGYSCGAAFMRIMSVSGRWL